MTIVWTKMQDFSRVLNKRLPSNLFSVFFRKPRLRRKLNLPFADLPPPPRRWTFFGNGTLTSVSTANNRSAEKLLEKPTVIYKWNSPDIRSVGGESAIPAAGNQS